MINDAFTVDPPLIVAWRSGGGGRFCVEQTTDAVHHCHPDRLRGSFATKEEWRGAEDACPAMMIQDAKNQPADPKP